MKTDLELSNIPLDQQTPPCWAGEWSAGGSLSETVGHAYWPCQQPAIEPLGLCEKHTAEIIEQKLIGEGELK